MLYHLLSAIAVILVVQGGRLLNSRRVAQARTSDAQVERNLMAQQVLDVLAWRRTSK